MIWDLILGPLGAIIGGVALAVLAWITGRQQGKRAAHDKQVRRDYENADRIETAADRARAADDAGAVDDIERLRKSGRLRD